MDSAASLQDFSDSTDEMLNASLVDEPSEEVQLGETYLQPQVRWLWIFPRHWDTKLKPFDDPIIKLLQTYHGGIWKWISLCITGCMAIEIAIAVPFVLYFVGYDGIATEFSYLALILSLVSQVPKRFVWRLRPYMAGRAIKVKKDMTSSFPSRAVTCAAVYSFAIIWAYIYVNTENKWSEMHALFRWWMPILFLVAIFLASFARINLGVHYPSDCVGGLLQGLFVCLMGTLLWKTDILGCSSCHSGRCYSSSDSTDISLEAGPSHMNWWLAAVMAGVAVAVPTISVAKPIDFWAKCDRVYGMLLPGIVFQALMLCPDSSKGHYSLRRPHSPHWYSFVLGIVLVCSATGIGLKFGGKRPLIMYFLLFTTLSTSLFLWRLTKM